MGTILAIVLPTIYAAGWTICARYLYEAWRPSDVVLCKKRHEHKLACYRRNRLMDPSLTIGIDSRSEAMGVAALAALIWFAVIPACLMMRNPRELPEERAVRVKRELAERDRKIAALELEVARAVETASETSVLLARLADPLGP